MCVSISKEFPAKRGETWFIKGVAYTVGITNMKYIDTNGDPDTLYVFLRPVGGTSDEGWVITRKAFLDKAKREEPIKDVFITPRQILDAEPCADGVQALGAVLGVSIWSDPPWLAANRIADKSMMDNAVKVSDLYTWYKNGIGRIPDISYLKFLAVVLGLIPRQIVQGPDRETLKRLLGIKE
jgi:hypothetical protein